MSLTLEQSFLKCGNAATKNRRDILGDTGDTVTIDYDDFQCIDRTTPFGEDISQDDSDFLIDSRNKITPPATFSIFTSHLPSHSEGRLGHISSEGRAALLNISGWENEIEEGISIIPFTDKHFFCGIIGEHLYQSLDLIKDSKNAQLSEAILKFAVKHGIYKALQKSLSLVAQIFKNTIQVDVNIATDPENNEEWLEISIPIGLDIDTFLEKYDLYTSRWVSLFDVNTRTYIRLSFSE